MSDTKKTKLYCGDLKGDTVNTSCSFGTVTFDHLGCAVVDATDDDLVMLASLSWLGDMPEPVLTPEEKALADLPREEVALYAPDFKNEAVGTSFGVVKFDANGYASWNATADELVKLHALRWVVQPQPTVENTQRARDNDPLRGPTIEEFVAAGYLPEEYPPPGYERRQSAGLTAFETGGTVPWDVRLVQAQREQLTRDRAEQAARDNATNKAESARAEIAARAVEASLPVVTVAETPAPTSVAADAVPSPSAKQQAKQAQKSK